MTDIEKTIFTILVNRKQCSPDSSLKLIETNGQTFEFLVTCSNNEVYQDFLNIICFFNFCKSLFIEKGYFSKDFKIRKLKNSFALYFYKNKVKELQYFGDSYEEAYAKAYLDFKKKDAELIG